MKIKDIDLLNEAYNDITAVTQQELRDQQAAQQSDEDEEYSDDEELEDEDEDEEVAEEEEPEDE